MVIALQVSTQQSNRWAKCVSTLDLYESLGGVLSNRPSIGIENPIRLIRSLRKLNHPGNLAAANTIGGEHLLGTLFKYSC